MATNHTSSQHAATDEEAVFVLERASGEGPWSPRAIPRSRFPVGEFPVQLKSLRNDFGTEDDQSRAALAEVYRTAGMPEDAFVAMQVLESHPSGPPSPPLSQNGDRALPETAPGLEPLLRRMRRFSQAQPRNPGIDGDANGAVLPVVYDDDEDDGPPRMLTPFTAHTGSSMATLTMLTDAQTPGQWANVPFTDEGYLNQHGPWLQCVAEIGQLVFHRSWRDTIIRVSAFRESDDELAAEGVVFVVAFLRVMDATLEISLAFV